jgi:hypothetical protein
MPPVDEQDFPPGHPARCDYDPKSPEAKEWARKHVWTAGERDFPVDHPAAMDTPGNKNRVTWRPGVDPEHPELEPFSGRTPEQVEAVRELWLEQGKRAKPSPELEPTVAPPPPKHPGDTRPPSGQPAQGLADALRDLAGRR